MSCISSNFSSFFLNSLNDPSEFAKYLSNGELKFSSFEDFQVFGAGGGSGSIGQSSTQQQQQYSQQQLNGGNASYNNNNNNNINGSSNSCSNGNGNGNGNSSSCNGNSLSNGNGNGSGSGSGTTSVTGNCNGGATNAAGVPSNSSEIFNGATTNNYMPSSHPHHNHNHPTGSSASVSGTAGAAAAAVVVAAAATAASSGSAAAPSSSSSSVSSSSLSHSSHLQGHQQMPLTHPLAHSHHPQQQQPQPPQQQQHLPPHHFGHLSGHSPNTTTPTTATAAFHHNHLIASPLHHTLSGHPSQGYTPSRWANGPSNPNTTPGTPSAVHAGPMHNNMPGTPITAHTAGAQHFDGSFEFLKYLRHSNDYNGDPSDSATVAANVAAPNSHMPTSANQRHHHPHQQQQQHPHQHHPQHQLQHQHQQHLQQTPHHHQQQQQPQPTSSTLIDLDSSTSHKSRSSRKVAALLSSVSRASNSLDATSTLDVFDHDSKHTIFDLHHMTNSSNSNESSLELSNLAFGNSHLNASNSNTSSEGAAAGSCDFPMLGSAAGSSAPKPLASFTIRENFEAHPSHKVEEGIFQHMNKLPPKKKENLKQLGVRFTGQMTLADKSIVVENFIKFCQEYDIKDHRPFLSLNQSGLNKPEQIKFARFLGQGLPTFTLFCIYSNFKNLFCTKRTEIYTKDGYNLPYILDKTKRFLANTTAGNTPSKQIHSVPQSQPLLQPPPPPLPSQTIQPPPQQQQPEQSPMTMGLSI